MPQLSQAKTVGGVGAILMLLGIVPAVGWVLSIAGAILVLVAIKYVSDILADPSIFKNMIVAVVLAIAGLVVGVAVVLSTVFATFGMGVLASNFGNMGAFTPSSIPPGNWVGLILGVITGLAAMWVVLLVSSIFVRRSYGSMASKLGVSMFGTAGLLYLIGAALTIVLVGIVIIFIAEILNIVAFFSIPDQLPAAPQPQPAPSQPPSPM